MDKKVVFILGAGCSVEDGSPLINNFLEVAFSEVKSTLTGDLKQRFDNVEKFWKSRLPYLDIEELLSFIDLESVLEITKTSENLSKLKSDLIYLIGKTIKNKMGTGTSQNYSEFQKNFIPEGANTILPTVISFNWDIAFDNVVIPKRFDMIGQLEEGDDENWIYNVDYGVPFKSLDNSGKCHNVSKEWTPAILKLHGSMNWLFCNKCKENNKHFRYFIHGKKIIVNVFEGEVVKCPECKEPLIPVIVTPTLKKIEEGGILSTIKDIWNHAFKSLVEAEYIFIVGYSFPADDVHFRLFFRSALFNNYYNNKKPIIVNIINYKKYSHDKNEFEKHYKEMIDIPNVEIRPVFHYLKFSEFAKQDHTQYIR